MSVLVDMMVNKLSAYAESHFMAQPGPPMAFFEIPQADADPVRAIYRIYAVRGNTLPEVERWMMDNVLVPLAQLTLGGGYLYWRLPQRFDVSYNEGGTVTLRTRIAVLNRSLVAVMLGNEKVEGSPVLDLTQPCHLERWITVGYAKVHVGYDSGVWYVNGVEQ